LDAASRANVAARPHLVRSDTNSTIPPRQELLHRPSRTSASAMIRHIGICWTRQQMARHEYGLADRREVPDVSPIRDDAPGSRPSRAHREAGALDSFRAPRRSQACFTRVSSEKRVGGRSPRPTISRTSSIRLAASSATRRKSRRLSVGEIRLEAETPPGSRREEPMPVAARVGTPEQLDRSPSAWMSRSARASCVVFARTVSGRESRTRRRQDAQVQSVEAPGASRSSSATAVARARPE